MIVRVKEEVRTSVLHPMDAKMQLAHNIIAGFHGEDAARKASEEFRRVFRERQAPDEATLFASSSEVSPNALLYCLSNWHLRPRAAKQNA